MQLLSMFNISLMYTLSNYICTENDFIVRDDTCTIIIVLSITLYKLDVVYRTGYIPVLQGN